MKKFMSLALLVLLGACSEDAEPKLGLTTLENGLVSYYPLDSDAKDQGPNSINGIAQGIVAAPDRKGNAKGAVYFDGTDDFIKVGNSLKLSDLQTIAFWVKFGRLEHGMPSMELVSKSTRRQGIEVLIHENRLEFYMMGTEKTNHVSISIDELNTSSWFFITVVHDMKAGRMKLYLNGELRDAGPAPADAIEVDNLMFGNWNYEQDPRFFQGYMDEVKIFNRPLTDEEIADLFSQDR